MASSHFVRQDSAQGVPHLVDPTIQQFQMSTNVQNIVYTTDRTVPQTIGGSLVHEKLHPSQLTQAQMQQGYGGMVQDSGHVVQMPDGTVTTEAAQAPPDQSSNADETPTIDIVINNVVSTFNTRCHLNLKRIALEGMHVIYKREQGMVSMKLRRPRVTASIWSSGKVTCTGATSNEDAKLAGRRVTRVLQNMGFKVRFTSFRVVNVLGTCTFPWGIRITQFSQDNPRESCYEPELHPGVTYRIKEPKATMKVFSTGSVTITAPSVDNVQAAVEYLYPIVVNYQMEKRNVSKHDDSNARLYSAAKRRYGGQQERYQAYNEFEDYSSCSEDYDESDDESDDGCI